MDVALHDRPALKEVLGILVACALLLAVLAKLDNTAAREYQARAVDALAAQKRAKPQAAAKVDARTESLGGRGPIALPAGAAWTARTSVDDRAAPAAAPAQPIADDSPPSPMPLMMLMVAGLLIAASGAVLSRRSV